MNGSIFFLLPSAIILHFPKISSNKSKPVIKFKRLKIASWIDIHKYLSYYMNNIFFHKKQRYSINKRGGFSMANNNQNFKEQLKEKGYKNTIQRKLVLDVIKENQGKHLSSEEIYNLVKKKYPHIGIATVYRALSLLEKLDLIYKVNLGKGTVKYDIERRDTSHRHHHLICIECGEIIEVEEDLLEDIEEKISYKYNFSIQDHSLKFYGYCQNCKQKIYQNIDQ